jgi:predicted nucleic acid-binding Zn ribbon protein
MKNIKCAHCSREVKAEDETCPNCGIPLTPNHANSSQKKFIIFFILLVIFSFVMMVLLPLFD